MENVTDRVSNPFGMQVPDDRPAVYGFGDVNADFHVIGDHPGRHGGVASGIPFTGSVAGRRLRRVLGDVGLLVDSDESPPTVRSVYLSYLHPAVPDGEPSDQEYADLERFLDAEVRAVTAHVLLPVGERAIEYVLGHYTAEAIADGDTEAHHAAELGTGAFLVVPVAEPSRWTAGQADALRDRLAAILSRDFRRESDLGRFLVGGDPYFVR
ncbi:MAG: uracil-DNA glycosylase family protein [Halodesulfurarchaeum sp.]